MHICGYTIYIFTQKKIYVYQRANDKQIPENKTRPNVLLIQIALRVTFFVSRLNILVFLFLSAFRIFIRILMSVDRTANGFSAYVHVFDITNPTA